GPWLVGTFTAVDPAGQPLLLPSELTGQWKVLTPKVCAALGDAWIGDAKPGQGPVTGELLNNRIILARKPGAPATVACKVRVELARPDEPPYSVESVVRDVT